MIIREISDHDLNTILKLNEASVTVLSPLDIDKLLVLKTLAAVSVVVEVDGEVVGFLLAFSAGVEYESVNYKWFCKRFENFLYIDRVVVSQSVRGKGIASALYGYVLNWARTHGLSHLLAEIDITPPNEPSLKFHQKLGFKQLDILQHNENKVVSLQALNVAE